MLCRKNRVRGHGDGINNGERRKGHLKIDRLMRIGRERTSEPEERDMRRENKRREGYRMKRHQKEIGKKVKKERSRNENQKAKKGRKW